MMSRLYKTKATGGQPMAFKTTHDTKSKRTGGRAENQGLLPQRCAVQSPPTWTRPPGADAADALDRCLRKWTLRRRS